MGWEMRRGKRCYYHKVRVDGRARSVYCGSGERGCKRDTMKQVANDIEFWRPLAEARTSYVPEIRLSVPPRLIPSPTLLRPPRPLPLRYLWTVSGLVHYFGRITATT